MAYASVLSFCSVLIRRIVLTCFVLFFLPAHVHVHVHFNANECVKCVMGLLFGTVCWQYLLTANHAAGLGRRHQFGCVILRPCIMPTKFDRRPSLLGSLFAEFGLSTRLGGSSSFPHCSNPVYFRATGGRIALIKRATMVSSDPSLVMNIFSSLVPRALGCLTYACLDRLGRNPQDLPATTKKPPKGYVQALHYMLKAMKQQLPSLQDLVMCMCAWC